VFGDITKLAVDVVVNAANETLLGGGGVDGAIHRAAGPELLAACRRHPEVRPGVRCPTGEARLTPAFALPARWVVHTVGPVWSDGSRGEPELLAACYDRSLELAAARESRSIAFPAISTGVYGYPKGPASHIASLRCATFLRRASSIERIVLVAYSAKDVQLLRDAVQRVDAVDEDLVC
jgi:O-acetyl-ADP-ribose deacetylase (regulator of RNase III)